MATLISLSFGNEKRFTLYSGDSLFTIESLVSPYEGTQHGAKEVKLTAVLEELPDTLTTTYTRRTLPIFKGLFPVSRGDVYAESPNLYLAVGWSSGGSGHESMEGWLISQSMDHIDVIDRFKLFKSRQFPDIVIDTASMEIAVSRSTKSHINRKNRDIDGWYFSLTIESGTREDLRGVSGKKSYQKELSRFNVTIPRPFRSESHLPGEIVRIIEVTPDGFVTKR